MSEALNCCGKPHLGDSRNELGSARGFDFTHRICTNCGTHWLQVYCNATSMPGYERITDQEAREMLAEKSLEARKQYMKDWADAHL